MLVAVVRRGFAQALDGPCRLVIVEAGEGRARALKPGDDRQRGIEVVSVEDRLVDRLEMDVGKAGGLEDPRGHVGIPEREWVQARWRWLRRVAERGVDQPHPFVVFEALPHEQHESRLCSQCGGDVRERGDRIGEEHGSEPADRHVEARGVEAMHLRVAALVGDVGEPFGRRQLTGALKHPLGHVDADNTARRRGARRLASRQPGSAADVEHLITGADPVSRAKMLVVCAQLGVIEIQADQRRHRRDATDVGQHRVRGRTLVQMSAEGLGRADDREVEPVTPRYMAGDASDASS